QLIFRLTGTVENAKSTPNRRFRRQRETQADSWIEVELRLVERMIRRQETVRSCCAIDVELDIPVMDFLQRRVMLKSQSIIQRNGRRDSPFVLSVGNVVRLFAFTIAGHSIVENARVGQISHEPVAGQTIRQKIRQVVVGVLRSSVAAGVEAYRSYFATKFHRVLIVHPGQVVDK